MTIPETVSALMASVGEVCQWQEDIYRDLHQNPELSHQEHRTAGIVAERLRLSGLEVITGVGGTGVVGVFSNGDGPTVLLRADMDALPVREATGLPYASKVTATGSRGAQSGLRTPVVMTCIRLASWARHTYSRQANSIGVARLSRYSSRLRRPWTAHKAWLTTDLPT